VLRSLASQGIFASAGEGEWAQTPLSETLRSDVPGSVRDMALMWNEEHYWAFGRLLDAVSSDRPAFDLHYGSDLWSYLRDHPEAAATFNAAMGNLVSEVHAAAAAAYDFTGVRHLVDVGAGHGTLAATLLADHPGLEATLFDLPHVVGGAAHTLARAGVADRGSTVGGDFFAAVPEGADAYLLSFILHDWSDDECAAILGNVRRAIAADGRLLIIENVLPDDDSPHFGKLINLTMLAMLPGKERTESEFAALLARAGFRLERVVATAAPVSVVEGRPV
jgi:O-methyltransferase